MQTDNPLIRNARYDAARNLMQERKKALTLAPDTLDPVGGVRGPALSQLG